MEIGTQFSCEGTLPALAAGQRHTDNATVSAKGEINGNTVTDSDLWSGHGKSYAVGDYVWIDKNRDGIQDAGEPVLSGVGVELLDATGAVVATTKTDKNGLYKFDNLEAGSYQVRFTLTEAQAKKYEYTSVNSGSDAAKDSNAAVTKDPRVGVTKKFVLDDSNTALTKTYAPGYDATEGIDPTWDAGVVEKKYAVGDYVWIDENHDGKQGKNEPALPGVKVELLDAHGKVIATTKTDKNGRYLFDELDPGTYQVRFTLTKQQSKTYGFTTVGQGSSAKDSDAKSGKKAPAVGVSKKFVLGDDNPSLTKKYDRDFTASEGIDPTWDAGVVKLPVAGGGLEKTGAPAGLWIAGFGGLGVALLGLGLMLLRRRRM
ncbi:MAG: carboxypeptidase regulatory-like domain-containing protein, partial [Actinobacteria bacterium]|nr:carboxypeptidase regulatory-like domain-containing protein [Actinomycetota bacterium]